MYLPNPRGVIQALDAATGDLIWEYRPEVERPGPAAGRRSRRAANRPTSRASLSGPRPHGRRRRRHGTRHPAEPRDFRRQDLRNTGDAHIIALDARTGKARLGHHGRGFEAGIRLHVGPDRRSRQSDCGDRRMQPLQRRRLLHHRPRRGHRKGAVAHVHRCEAGGARRRDMGRSAAQVPGRQRRLDPRQLRCGREPGLLGHGAGEAVGASRARHRRVAPSTRIRRSRSIPTPGR